MCMIQPHHWYRWFINQLHPVIETSSKTKQNKTKQNKTKTTQSSNTIIHPPHHPHQLNECNQQQQQNWLVKTWGQIFELGRGIEVESEALKWNWKKKERNDTGMAVKVEFQGISKMDDWLLASPISFVISHRLDQVIVKFDWIDSLLSSYNLYFLHRQMKFEMKEGSVMPMPWRSSLILYWFFIDLRASLFQSYFISFSHFLSSCHSNHKAFLFFFCFSIAAPAFVSK